MSKKETPKPSTSNPKVDVNNSIGDKVKLNMPRFQNPPPPPPPKADKKD